MMKKIDVWKTDKQTKMSCALDMEQNIQQRSLFNKSAQKMSGTVNFGADMTRQQSQFFHGYYAAGVVVAKPFELYVFCET